MNRLLSEKNHVHKHHNGFIYRLDKRIGGGAESWRCPWKDCRGRIHINNEGTMCEVGEHNHVVNPGVVEAKLGVTQIKQRAENSRDAPRLLIRQASATLNEAIPEVPRYNSLQRTIQRKRKINGKPVANPRTIQEIDVPAQLRQTLRGDDFLLYDSGISIC